MYFKIEKKIIFQLVIYAFYTQSELPQFTTDFYSDYSDKGNFEIEHPTGMSKLSFEIEYHNNEIKNLIAGTTRHARLIMSGHVHIQKSLLNK